MGNCISNSGAWEPPYAQALNDYVTEHDQIVRPTAVTQAAESPVQAVPIVKPPAAPVQVVYEEPLPLPLPPPPPPSLPLDKREDIVPITTVFKRRSTVPGPPVQSRSQPKPPPSSPTSGPSRGYAVSAPTTAISGSSQGHIVSALTPPTSGPSQDNTWHTPAPSEKTSTQLLGQLYDLNVPDADIALFIKTMRGNGTKDEEALLLQRLYTLQVPTAVIAQLVDVMRLPTVAVVRPVNMDELPEDAPPMYDFKGTQVLA